MKQLLLLLAAAITMQACMVDNYLIEGYLPPPGRAVLSYKTPEGEAVSDTVSPRNGHFRFRGRVSDVVLGTLAIVPDNGTGVATSIFIENAHIKVTLDQDKAIDDGMFGDLASIHEPVFTGGPNNEFFTAFCALGRDRSSRKKLIAATKDVEAAAYMSRPYFSDEPLAVFDSVFGGFTARVQECFLARGAREELAARKRVAPGSPAPDFTLKNIRGEDISLSSLRGSYVLIDFWASWCVPCREGMPLLKSLYDRYHEKGLEIVGIANEHNGEDWRRAIEHDGSAWIQLRDEFPERGKPARVASQYAVHSIPAFFLIDREGIIISTPEHGQLEQALSGLLD